MNDKRIKILRDMDTGKAIIKLAIPAIISFIVMAVYNVADTVFVSWWSYKGSAAVQVIFPIMMISSAIGLTLGIGGGSYISRLLGQNNIKQANAVISTSIFTGIFAGVVYVAITLYFLKDIVSIFGASGEIIHLSVDYGIYIVIGSFFVIISMVLNNALRSEGSGMHSMIGMGIGSILNILLDPLFIFTFDWGLKGAAIATIISQAISCIILYQFYLRKKTILEIHFRCVKVDLGIYKEIFKIGLPTFFRQVLFSLSMGILNEGADMAGGAYLLSAMGISIKVTSLMGFFVFGMGQGLQPVVGYNFGAKNMERVISAQKHGIIQTTSGTLIGTILMMVFAKPIMSIFVNQPEVLSYGVYAIRVLAFGIIFMAVSNTIVVVFQAIGHGRAALLFSVLRQGILLIPAIILMTRFFEAKGLIWSQTVADILTLIISFVVYIPFIKRESDKLKKAV